MNYDCKARHVVHAREQMDMEGNYTLKLILERFTFSQLFDGI